MHSIYLGGIIVTRKNQSYRLTNQHKKSLGVVGIFNNNAKSHDLSVNDISTLLVTKLKDIYPNLNFRHRKTLSKKEINEALNKMDDCLGKTLFVPSAQIRPDGGIIEVQDDNNQWRVILVSEAKYQGKDIENIKAGKLVGSKNNQDLMSAGNAIERSHKNISEIANYMIAESHFPYVIFLEGSNFLTKNLKVTRPDGRIVTLDYQSGSLNRLDRLSAANYGMPFNENLCKNRFVSYKDQAMMLQAASMYTTGDGSKWTPDKMFNIMLDIAETSLQMLGRDLFQQLTENK